jgi:5-methyltetrahydropteroyltriglutamate--homocysteine methyltransferase
MSADGDDGYRGEVVGSLLRPAYLKQAVQQYEAGGMTAEELAAAQDRAVLEAIALQNACDLDVITDGEMRRLSWRDPLIRGLAGYGQNPQAGEPLPAGRRATNLPARLQAVTGRLQLLANLPLQEWSFLRQHTDRPYKATLPSLTSASVLWVPGVSDRVYPDRHEYLRDALRLMREVVAQLAAGGVRYVQIDAPRYTHLLGEAGLENFRRLGIDARTWLGEMIALDNALMADSPT